MENEVQEVEVSLFDDNGQPKDIPTAVEAEAPKKEDEAPTFEVPEKFKDKSLEEVIQSYVHLEKEYGNKSNEVGELRKWADTLLQAQPKTQPQETEAEDDEVGFDEFIDDPQVAVNKALANNPTIQRLEQNAAQQQADVSRAALLEKHPDADQIVMSPEFQAWVMESPNRQRELQRAHVRNDADAANDLLDYYKATRKATNEEATQERDAKAGAALKDAAVEAGGAPSGQGTKPVFKRSELIELKLRDPAKYESMKDIIYEAYADKRVR